MSAIQLVQIRQPATANLMINSEDRTSGTMDNFIIQQKKSILNGFFHRVATTEVVLDWGVENIQATYGNNTFTVQVVAIGSPTYTVTLLDGFYTVEEALDAIVVGLNAAGTGLTWSIVNSPGTVSLHTATGTWRVLETTLSNQLHLDPDAPADSDAYIIAPDLRLYKYIDFVSAQLTYNQKLKDASTAPTERDVLCRWYMSWDNPPNLDGYGFPILMGYNAFNARRLFNPAKQIRWENNMPIGQIAFQVYGDDGQLLSKTSGLNTAFSQWLMTLQVSED
jgi:hypothetical protein